MPGKPSNSEDAAESSKSAVERNVGGIDRGIRAALAVLLGLVGLWSVLSGMWLYGALAFAGAAGFTFNVVTGFCGVNAMLGINTCSWDGGSEQNEAS